VPLRAFLIGLLITIAVGIGATPASAADSTTVRDIVAATPDDTPPITANPFLPQDRGLGECISAVPKPGCSSEARGGGHQQLVLLALVGGLAFIGWRIIHGVRSGRRQLTQSGSQAAEGQLPPAF
jgi:hypothetical protein